MKSGGAENTYIVERADASILSEKDLECCLGLEARSFSEAWSPSLFISTIRETRNVLFLIRERESAVIRGFACFSTVCDEAELLQICIDGEVRHQGLGHKLLLNALENLKKTGIVHYFLEVRESNSSAIALYQRMGFQQDAVRKGYYRATADIPAENALIMSLHFQVN